MSRIEFNSLGLLSHALKPNFTKKTEKVIDLSISALENTEVVEFICAPRIAKKKNYLVFSTKIKVQAEQLQNLEFGLHWGKIGENWSDQFFLSDEIIIKNTTDTIELVKAVSPTSAGQYGLTLFIKSKKTDQRFWLADFGIPNQRFDISAPFLSSITNSAKRAVELVDEIVALSQAINDLRDFESFVDFLILQSKAKSRKTFSKNLLEIIKSDAALRDRIEGFARQCLNVEGQISKNRGLRALAILRTIGLSEIAFVSPEGPNASAGGLAQVIGGLSQALVRKSLKVTLILPLYESANGSKHTSAQNIISNGIDLFGKRVSVKKYGTLRFRLGNTRDAATGELKASSEIVEAHVYRAMKGNVRVFLLRNARYANKLYTFNSWDDQLRQSLFLSRAAVELIKNPVFEISPEVVVSNDWMTALVPILLKTDRRYSKSSRLKDIKSCHIIHNAGRAYQGKLFVNQYGEDLWPIFNLNDEHFFGLQDSEDPSQLNLSKGAIFHAHSVVTVSKPYAEQLLTADGGEGLDTILDKRKSALFGVSNGVDLNSLQKSLWQKYSSEKRFSATAFSSKLDSLKAYSKLAVQKKLALPEGINYKLISLVGRITEQKGLSLLVSNLQGNTQCLLEKVLDSQVQVVIAGPVSLGDKAALKVCAKLEQLKIKYPQQLRLVFDYVPHAEAMEITHASDIFLMPSRYEPGGITQLEALASGALVVARNVGGLKATLSNVDKVNHTGNAFLFDAFTPEAFEKSLLSAIDYLSNTKRLSSLRLRNARSKNDWSDRVESYLAIFQNSIGALDFKFLESRKQHLQMLRPDK